MLQAMLIGREASEVVKSPVLRGFLQRKTWLGEDGRKRGLGDKLAG